MFYGESHADLRLCPSDASDSVICFQLAYHTAVILIHRPFFGDSEGSQTKIQALQAATGAATAICRLLREYQKSHTLHSLPPQTMNYIVCAAVIHLLNATCGRTSLGRRSTGNLNTCMDALLVVGNRWASRLSTSIRFIRELAHKWKVVWALPLQFCAPLIIQNASSELHYTEDEHSVAQYDGHGVLPGLQAPNYGLNRLEPFIEADDISVLERLFAGEES